MSLPVDVKSEVLRLTKEGGIKQVRFLYCDNGGIIRGKACGYQSLAERMHGGIGLTLAMQAMNSLDELQKVEGIGAVGEVRLVPDPRTFRILPYSPRAAAMLCDMITLEGMPWELLGTRHENFDLYGERSPVSFAQHIKAPLMIIMGAEDRRVPAAQGEEMIEALKKAGKTDFEYVSYAGEGHGWRKVETLLDHHRHMQEFLKKWVLER